VDQNQRKYCLSSLKKYGKNSLSYLTLADDLEIYRCMQDGYIAYKDFFKSATILSDPIVSEKTIENAIHDFTTSFSSKNYHISVFLCTKNSIDILKKAGYRCYYVGMEGVVDLATFSIAGGKKSSIRSSVNYAKRHQMIVEEYIYSKQKRSKEIETEIISLSNEWCQLRKTHEFSFAFGTVDFVINNDIRYFVCKQNGKIVGFISYYPIFGSKSYYLDLMRIGRHAPRGTIDYLFVQSFETLKNEGAKKIYIGFSPFSYLNHPSSINSRFYTNLFNLMKPLFEKFYPAQSEFFFKSKFATEWEPNYVAFYPRIGIRNLLSLLHSLCKGGLAPFIFQKSPLARLCYKKQ